MRRLSFPISGLLLAACAGTPAGEKASEPQGPPLPEVEVRARLEKGRTIGLRFDLPGVPSRRLRALEAWVGEALEQSPYFDFDLRGEHGTTLVLRGELPSLGRTEGSLTTGLVREGAPPLPLRGVRFAGDDLCLALDRLCLETRLALGEPPDSVRKERRSCAVLVSEDERVAEAIGQAWTLIGRRRLALASARLQDALRRDPTCALALSMAAGLRMDLGLPKKALELVLRLRECEGRASPRALHRAGRIWLMAGRNYEGLLELAENDARDRPFDPQIRFTALLGLSMLGRYEEALPGLRALVRRLPDSPGVLFCLGHAFLALGRLDEAEKLLPAIRLHVPPASTARFEIWLRFAQGRHELVEKKLSELVSNLGRGSPRALLQTLSMQASHALLRRRDDEASRILFRILESFRARPSLLLEEHRLLLDTVWTLVRLGKAEPASEILRQVSPPRSAKAAERGPSFVAYALCRLALGRDVPARAIEELDSMGLSTWKARLQAADRMRRGQPRLALTALRAAEARSEDPALVWEMVEAWRAQGRLDAALPVLRDLVRALARPRMDLPHRHPLASPALAFMYREALLALSPR